MTNDTMLSALRIFAEAVTTKINALGSGEPEEQLRGPFERLLDNLQAPFKLKIVSKGEVRLDRLGKPDFAIHCNGLLAGYVEMKAPGKGASPDRFKGHDKTQWKRFKNLPNIIYTDGNEWSLFRDGKREGRLIRLAGDVSSAGKNAVEPDDAAALVPLLRNFLLWDPIIPKKTKQLAELLAPLCRMLRDDVTEALGNPDSPLVILARDWREMLFPEAKDREFADAYAQTLTFALLLARSEGADTLKLDEAINTLNIEHPLLSRAFRILTEPSAQDEISASLNMLQRITERIPVTTLEDPTKDPWLYFYEDFLAAYDPKLRKDAGVYYTPVEVVTAQVRLVDDLLVNQLGKPMGFADQGVVTLDPAVGTGTYLLSIIQHALGRVEKEQGPGAVPGQAGTLGSQLFGFEKMVGPYAVAQLRVSRALLERGGALPKDGPGIYLTDTLESPHTEPPRLPLILRPLADQHKKALHIKDNVPVLVCIGNPPYDRHEATDGNNNKRTGGWVRWGDAEDGSDAILNVFRKPAIEAGHGGDLKNLYNLYVYFWRWSLWKIFEHKTAAGPGVVSFITASSYLDGDAFVGVREHLRRICDEVWVLDLGGEGRGTRKEENVFNIQTPVAIAIAVRYGDPKTKTPAKVHYARIAGKQKDKLKRLKDVKNFTSLTWRNCPEKWHAPFRPAGTGDFFNWPLLTNIFPWQQSGIKAGRTWVVAPDQDTLGRRWQKLCRTGKEDETRNLFKDSPTGKKIHDEPHNILPPGNKLKAISMLKPREVEPTIQRCSYRSFNREYIIADARCIDRPSPQLWEAHGTRQIYLASLFSQPLGEGPAVTACAEIPDLHYFSGRGAKDTIPLYRNRAADEANIAPGLRQTLEKILGNQISPEDFLAYAYGILANPEYTARFRDELENREIRVPITKNADLFKKVRDIGRKLLWLHTYGERLVPKGERPGRVPPGSAKCLKAVPDAPENYPESYSYNETAQTLSVGKGRFAPVRLEVFEFEVSGLKVVQSWLNYRMKKGHGRKSSPLDDIRPERWTSEFTTELLNLLWILEATLAEYPRQKELLEAVVSGDVFKADELPDVPDEMRKPPKKDSKKLSLGI